MVVDFWILRFVVDPEKPCVFRQRVAGSSSLPRDPFSFLAQRIRHALWGESKPAARQPGVECPDGRSNGTLELFSLKKPRMLARII